MVGKFKGTSHSGLKSGIFLEKLYYLVFYHILYYPAISISYRTFFPNFSPLCIRVLASLGMVWLKKKIYQDTLKNLVKFCLCHIEVVVHMKLFLQTMKMLKEQLITAIMIPILEGLFLKFCMSMPMEELNLDVMNSTFIPRIISN